MVWSLNSPTGEWIVENEVNSNLAIMPPNHRKRWTDLVSRKEERKSLWWLQFMKTSKLWEETFIDEGSATAISLILRAKRFNRYWKKAYTQLYPQLGKKAKEYVDEILPQIKLVTKKELDARTCIFCNKKKCYHGKRWLAPIMLMS